MTWNVSAGGLKGDAVQAVDAQLVQQATGLGWRLFKIVEIHHAIEKAVYALTGDSCSVNANGHGDQMTISVSSYQSAS